MLIRRPRGFFHLGERKWGRVAESTRCRLTNVVQMCDIFVRWHGSDCQGVGIFGEHVAGGLGQIPCVRIPRCQRLRTVCLLSAHAFGIDFYAVIIFSKRLTMSPVRYPIWGAYRSGAGTTASTATPPVCLRGNNEVSPRVENTLEKI